MNYQSQFSNGINDMPMQFSNPDLFSNGGISNIDSNRTAVTTQGSSLFTSDPIPTLGRVPLNRTTSLLESIQSPQSPFAQTSSHPLHSGSAPFTNGWQTQTSTSKSGLGHAPYGPNLHVSASTPSLTDQPSSLTTPTANSNNFAHVLLGKSTSIDPRGTGLSAEFPMFRESQWKYIDSQGNIQGPFSSREMSQWYALGYFQPNLQISRIPNDIKNPFGPLDNFIPLGGLISKVNDFQNPFLAFDRIINTNNVSGNLSQQSAVSQMEGNTRTSTQLANIHSNDFTYDELLHLKEPDGSYYKETMVQIPVSRQNQEKLDPNVDIQQYSNKENTASPSTVNSNQMAQPGVEKSEAKPKKEAIAMLEAKRRQEKAELMAKAIIEEQQQEEEQKKKKEQEKLAKREQPKNKLQDLKSNKATKPTENDNIEKESDFPQESAKISVKKATATSSVAPWANKVNKVEPTDLSDIQKQLDANNSKKQKIKQLTSQVNAMKLQQEIINEERKGQEMKSVLTWANKKQQAPVPVDIKSEIEKLPKQKNNSNKNAGLESLTINELSDPSFIETQKKLWEDAQLLKNRSKSSTVEDHSWTTVTSKSSKANTSNGNSNTKTISQPSSYMSPDKLRAIASNNSAVKTKQIGSSTSIPGLKNTTIVNHTPTYPGNASIAARQDFIKWCKSQMRLDPGLKLNSVLEVLFSLPAGPESKEIIADTIYSNSSTMDGRRFAAEFIKRRIECEKQIVDPLTWTEVLALPEGNNDDYEFQLVSKKKGRKH